MPNLADIPRITAFWRRTQGDCRIKIAILDVPADLGTCLFCWDYVIHLFREFRLFCSLRLFRVRSILRQNGNYSIDEETSKIYGKFRAEIFDKFAPTDKAKRRNFDIKDIGVRINDLWIACTAIQHDLIILSQDNDFSIMNQVRNLKLECWKT